MLWTARSNNKKTGDIPTGWVGEKKEETAASCKGCQMFKNTPNEKYSCYAWRGMVHTGLNRVQTTAAARPDDYSLKVALAKRAKTAKAVRLGSIGDPGAIPIKLMRSYAKYIRSQGLSILCYTHRWRKLSAAWYKLSMASCDTVEQVDEAASKGWRTTVIVPSSFINVKRFKTPQGRDVVIYPAMRAAHLGVKAITCNECRLCDASRDGPQIGFPKH